MHEKITFFCCGVVAACSCAYLLLFLVHTYYRHFKSNQWALQQQVAATLQQQNVVFPMNWLCARVFRNLFYTFITIRLGTKNEKTYYPTHMRYSSWLIGIIGGYILFKCQNRTIRIPKVIYRLYIWIKPIYLNISSFEHSSSICSHGLFRSV